MNARELHAFLESKQDFATWIKNRIEQYGFIENQDFVRFHKKMEANNATLIDYHIALDMAKELSMVERTPKGKEARLYFIECEKRAKQAPTPAILALPFNINDPMSIVDWTKSLLLEGKQREATKDAIIQEQSRVLIEQREHLKEQKEIEVFVKQMQESKKSKSFTEVSKILSDAFDYSINAENLRVFCILKRFLTLAGLPSDKYRAKKYFKVFSVYLESTGEFQIKTRITGNGLMFLSQEVKAYKIFFTLKRAEWKPLIDHIKDGEKQRRNFIESLKNATHYSNTDLLV